VGAHYPVPHLFVFNQFTLLWFSQVYYHWYLYWLSLYLIPHFYQQSDESSPLCAWQYLSVLVSVFFWLRFDSFVRFLALFLIICSVVIVVEFFHLWRRHFFPFCFSQILYVIHIVFLCVICGFVSCQFS